MDYLYYEVPSLARKEDAIEYIREHHEHNSNINGSGGLDRYLDDYEGWLQKLEDYKQPSEDRVPALTYFLVRESDNKIIGMANIRLYLNDRLREEGGHIGYGIRPSERRKGYATEMIKLALEECKKLGIYEVLMTCDSDNIGSEKSIINNGGVLENIVIDENGKKIKRFWIKIKEELK